MTDEFYESVAVWSQIVASGLFIVALVVIWQRYIGPAVLAAQARKNADLLEAEKRRDEARTAVEDAQAELNRAEGDVRTIAQRADADAARIRAKILADAQIEGERLLRGAEGELERARTGAREQFRADLLERAMQIAREAAVRLDDGTNRRLVGDTVESAERGGTR
jgi:F0F1-type ATP synthase membrane subunit b/b'